MHQCDPRVRGIRRTNQKTFGGAAAGQPDADQPCREHARVVEHQQIAGAQQRWKIGKVVMGNGAGGPLQRQQAAAAAFDRRVLRDQRFRQAEIEIGNVQGQWITGCSPARCRCQSAARIDHNT